MSLQSIPSGIEPQWPTLGNLCFITLLWVFLLFVSFSTYSLVLAGITAEVNYLSPSPYLRFALRESVVRENRFRGLLLSWLPGRPLALKSSGHLCGHL